MGSKLGWGVSSLNSAMNKPTLKGIPPRCCDTGLKCVPSKTRGKLKHIKLQTQKSRASILESAPPDPNDWEGLSIAGIVVFVSAGAQEKQYFWLDQRVRRCLAAISSLVIRSNFCKCIIKIKNVWHLSLSFIEKLSPNILFIRPMPGEFS